MKKVLGVALFQTINLHLSTKQSHASDNTTILKNVNTYLIAKLLNLLFIRIFCDFIS